MLRLIRIVVFLVLGVSGFLALDYSLSGRWTGRAVEGLTFAEYLRAMMPLPRGADRPQGLQAMLPKPPEGWTVHPTEPGDLDAFLPADRTSLPGEVLALLEAAAAPNPGSGVQTAILTYKRGGRQVIVQAIRHSAPTLARMPLSDAIPLTPAMTVRGLDLAEAALPGSARARLFLADIGGQIRLNLLVSARMKDRDLVPFLQTLDVAALNDSVSDRRPGLGQVPMIVLASALGKEARAAFEADVAARAAARPTAEPATAAAPRDRGGSLFGTIFGWDRAEAAAR